MAKDSPTLAEFLGRLNQSGLVSAEDTAQLAEVTQEPQILARRLVNKGLLTSFQAAALFQGYPPQLVLGNYELKDRIGVGGMGEVYVALHRRLEREVAIKLISHQRLSSKKAIKRFQRESVLCAKLTHPNIVITHDAGEEEGVHYLVMEYIDGINLGQQIKRNELPALEEAIDYTRQAALGLGYAHQQGIVHRDVKPGNLLVDKNGVVKLLDLGLSCLVTGIDDAGELTRSGEIAGTIDYMAPEQALNMKHADARSDIYSLGCTLHALVTGKVPLTGETVVEKILAHREHAPGSLRQALNVPQKLDDLYLQMLAKDPAGRPQTMQEVAQRLLKILEEIRGSLDSCPPVLPLYNRVNAPRRVPTKPPSGETKPPLPEKKKENVQPPPQQIPAVPAAPPPFESERARESGREQEHSLWPPGMSQISVPPELPKSSARVSDPPIFPPALATFPSANTSNITTAKPPTKQERISRKTPQLQKKNRAKHNLILLVMGVLLPSMTLTGIVFHYVFNPGEETGEDHNQPAASVLETDPRLDSHISMPRKNVEEPEIPRQINFPLLSLENRNSTARNQILKDQGLLDLEYKNAIANGLKWLAGQQNEDGSWSLHKSSGAIQNDVAGTGLALLPLLTFGQTHIEGTYKAKVADGLDWLIKNQKEAGGYESATFSNSNIYAHAIAAMVLTEAYGMTDDQKLQRPAQLAIDYLVATQHDEGGWRYMPKYPGDTSVFGWVMTALKTAQAANLNVPDETFKKAKSYLDSVAINNGSRFSYMKSYAPRESMTAVGLLCRFYFGEKTSDPGVSEALEYLLKNYSPSSRTHNMYYWYYATQVMHHAGGEQWQEWEQEMRPLLIQSQVDDGLYAGSWSPVGPHSSAGGRIYETSLALLSLQVYYRHKLNYQE